MSMTQNIQHLIIRTSQGLPAINAVHERELYSYIYSYLIARKCYVYRIGGMPDHIHILINLPPTIAVSDLMRDLKMSAGAWLKSSGLFPDFTHWSRGYGAFSRSFSQIESIKDYIKNQKQHHIAEEFADEYRRLSNECGLNFF